MRGYPSFPNVFHADSTSNINLLDQPINTPIASNLYTTNSSRNNNSGLNGSRNLNYNEFNNNSYNNDNQYMISNHQNYFQRHHQPANYMNKNNINFNENNSINNLYRNNSFHGRINRNNNVCNNQNNSNNNGKSLQAHSTNRNNMEYGDASRDNDLNNSSTSLHEITSSKNNKRLLSRAKVGLPQGKKTELNTTILRKFHKKEEIPAFSISKQDKNLNSGSLNDGEKNGYFLWIVTPVIASLSLAIVTAALAGPQWLFTEEKLPNPLYNGTTTFKTHDNGAFVTKYTKSSLWILCSAMQGMQSYNCSKIDYFPNEEYRPDQIDSTLAIPYTITKSSPFFMASGIFLLISFIIFLIPTISHQNNLYYFSAGILFVVSGLIMLVGLIVYISIFKAEIGSKLRPKSSLQPPLFKFTYGQSFFLYVFGFITVEFVGVLNIFLYISLQQIGYTKDKVSCLQFSNMENDENAKDKNDEDDEDYMCRKHLIPTNLLYENDLEKRYYFEKQQKCNLHSKNLAKSLNQLYTEPAPTFSAFDLPSEYPLTRSVSTGTEIFSNNATNSNTLEKKDKNHGSNNKDSFQNIWSLSSGISQGIRKTKDELFNEFCKRAGFRPKPKNIYYIEDTPTNDDVYIVDYPLRSRRNSYVGQQRKGISKGISNISLHTLHQQQHDKVHPKSLFDLNRLDEDAWNEYPDQYFNVNGSKSNDLHQSRTLPRSFLKRNFESNENLYPPRLSLGSKDAVLNSNYNFHKSCEDLNFISIPPPPPPAKKISNNLEVKWPSMIPGSPSAFSIRSARMNNCDVISNLHIPVTPQLSGNDRNQSEPLKNIANNNHVFRRAYAFDDRRSEAFDSFDLDEIEKERRQSHASLFGENSNYDIFNGTAV